MGNSELFEIVVLILVVILGILIFYASFTRHYSKESRFEFVNKFKKYYRKNPKKVIIIIAVLIIIIILSNLYKPDWLVLTPSGLQNP